VTVDDQKNLAHRFEESRPHLRAVALRMLGTRTEADDAVQEAWLRLSRSDASNIDNLGGWLTTVVARVSLDMLRARRARREDEVVADLGGHADPVDLEREVMLADAVGPALLVVLETLAPAERLAFVLHDMFGVSFEEIAPIVARSPAAARQLASRARRRVRGGDAALETDERRQREAVEAFLSAARGGDFAALLAVLDPDVVVRADAGAQALGAAIEERGVDTVAKTWLGRARGARVFRVDGAPGAAWMVAERPKIVFDFTVEDGRIVAIDLHGDVDFLALVQLEPQN
jgi:RNA polymerase sigma factor (sigma-70 family)